MVLEIRLKNFFSIKDEISLDFRAAKINTEGAKALSDNIIDFNGQKILKSIGLFGANASGKSNIILAIKKCCEVILYSHLNNEGSTFKFSPFKFDNYADKPSSFYINFIYENIEYEYSFSLTSTEIQMESLYFYPNGRKVKVFTRDETKGTTKQKKYNFPNGHIPRPFDVAINTSNKTLFLSRASQMDRDFCKKLYRFFIDNFDARDSLLNCLDFPHIENKQVFIRNKKLFLHALSICDSDIIDIITQNTSQSNFKFETIHKNTPSIKFDFLTEESAGTIQLFNMLFSILGIAKNGNIFIMDEFDLRLHTKLADFIIDLFHASSKAQFLFTTHNTNLINVKRFRRDQILFTNKKDDGSTELYSLYDHKDFRENMDAEKGYLQGRFDAIPIVDNSVATLKKLLENTEPV